MQNILLYIMEIGQYVSVRSQITKLTFYKKTKRALKIKPGNSVATLHLTLVTRESFIG